MLAWLGLEGGNEIWGGHGRLIDVDLHRVCEEVREHQLEVVESRVGDELPLEVLLITVRAAGDVVGVRDRVGLVGGGLDPSVVAVGRRVGVRVAEVDWA